MAVELHLPDLPEVALSLGGDAPRPAPGPRQPWHGRGREAFAAYLPLVLMALLAGATGWLVKHTPLPSGPVAPRAVSAEPDYTMTQFSLERFDNAGRLKLRIEGARLRHFPATDRIEIDDARIEAWSPDGRLTRARATRALGTGDGSEMQLIGAAEVDGSDAAGRPLTLRGEFLHAFALLERVRSHLPVTVDQAGSRITADAFAYDHAQGRLDLQGRSRTELAPRAR